MFRTGIALQHSTAETFGAKGLGAWGNYRKSVDIYSTKIRMGRDGKAVQIKYTNGNIKDITAARVKEWIPNSHPKAPKGAMQKVEFKNSLPGSKGYKRFPTKTELDFLKKVR